MPRHFLSRLRAAYILFGACLALAALSATPSHTQAQPALLTKPRFAIAIAQAIQADPSVTSFMLIGDSEIRVKTRDGRSLSFFLDNAYADYRREPRDIPELAQKYFGSLLKPAPKRAEVDRSRIIPIVKDRVWLKQFNEIHRKNGGGAEARGLVDDLNDELIIIYAEDLPKTTRYLTVGEFSKLGVDRSKLRALAVANLRKLVPSISIRSYGGVLSEVIGDGDYNASLLLFDELWTNEQMKVEGELMVAVPARDLVLVAGAKDPRSLKMIRELAVKYAKESPHYLTPTIFARRDGRFVPLAEK